MMLIDVAARAIEAWSAMYRDSAALQTGVAFAHIGALVTSGGLAVSQDRALLKVPPGDVTAREARLRELRGSHPTVITGLAIVFASGVLFFLADLETFLPSKLFWAKIGFVAVLVANRRPAQGLALFLAASVSQWTLAMGALPIAYFAGGGGTSMPLDAHQHLELGFTIALTLFAVAALVSLRPERVDAALITGLVALQLVYPSASTSRTGAGKAVRSSPTSRNFSTYLENLAP